MFYVYFAVEKFPAYGQLSNRKTEEAYSGVRIDNEDNKQNALDFALWKSAKEVDNYGDIGFVYRLVRSLSSSKIQNLFPSISIKLRLVVDNLNSFSKMAPEVLCNVPEQNVNGWTILDWNDEKNCNELYKKNPPDIIQIGRASCRERV